MSEAATPPIHPLTSVARWIPGRPTGYAGEANEAQWKAAVRAAFTDVSIPAPARVSVEVDFVLHPSQVDRNAPDLDNLIKSTIDALDLLGPRTGNHRHAQPDDERIDRIVATKRVAGPGEESGARLVVSPLPRPRP